MPVLVGIGDADAIAVVELDLARALDLQEEKLDGIRRPADDRRLERLAASVAKRLGALLNLGSRVVGHEPPAFDASAQPEVARFRRHVAEIHHDQVIGHAEDRAAGMTVSRARLPRSSGS